MNIRDLEEIKEINNRELVVDMRYHCNPDPRIIQSLADNFDPLLFNPIKVVYRDGKYFIVDGVHIREALVKLKGTDDFPILCRVFTDLSAEDEAQLYAQLHGYNKPSINYTNKLRTMYHAKDADTIRFVEVTEANGFEVNMNNHHSKNGTITAIYTTFKAFMDLGELRYGRMLRLIRSVWNGEPWSLSRNMICGMARFIRMYDFSDEEFMAAFQSVGKADIDAGVESFHSLSREEAFANAIAQLFNECSDTQEES